LFNFKIAGIAAGAAFAFSLLIGLMNRIGPLVLLFRALLFAAVFFGLSCLVFWLLGQFVPELLSDPEDELDIPAAGSQVNITLGGPGEGAFPSDGSEEVDDIAGRPGASFSRERSAGAPLDQDGNDLYTKREDLVDGLGSPAAGVSQGDVPVSFAPPDDAEELPGMEDFSDAPRPPEKGSDSEAFSFDDPAPKRSGSRPGKQSPAGDFDPKDLARAIQTALKKDEKG
jgi:hypothetical protein